MAGLESLVGGWFASPVIGRVVEKAEEYLRANWELQKGTQEMVENLTGTLIPCQAAVKEVEKRAIINNPALGEWLRRLKQAVYDVEDVLDNMEAQSIKDDVQGKNKVLKMASSSFSSIRKLVFSDDNLKTLKKIVDQMNQLSNDIPKIHNVVNLNEKNESHTSEITYPRETISQSLEDMGLYGREDELNLILDIIVRSESESSRKGEQNYHGLFVIPIVGMGGVGKTALAQAVYNHPEVQQTFAKRAWISVSNKPDVLLVMRKIIQSLKRDLVPSPSRHLDILTTVPLDPLDPNFEPPPIVRSYPIGPSSQHPHFELPPSVRPYPEGPNSEHSNFEHCPYPNVITLENISMELSSIIRGVKFLIILDDMFESEWDVIYATLSRGAPGSVVLITSQNEVFANRIGTFSPIALRALDPDEFWELFTHFVFGYRTPVSLLDSLFGHRTPVSLLDSLFGYRTRYRWIPGPRQIIPVKQQILRSIADKLHGLPLAAKIIGKTLRSNMNIDRWMRISKSEWWDLPEGKTQILPAIGLGYEQLDPCLRECFAYCSLFPRNSLIEKDRLVHIWIALNFIQSDVNGVMKLEDIGRQWFDELVEKSFFQRAWDNNSYVMHELMHDLAVIVSSGECFYLGEGVAEIPKGVRHLAVDTNNLEVIKGIQKHKNLRSFLFFGCGEVEGMYSGINDTLSNLESIRVLDLSYMCMDKYSEPPRAIWKLQHLRFLDLTSTGIEILTRFSVDLYHLQSLYIRKCKFLALPRGINKLKNLRHLCADKETIAQISGIGQLTNLQELGVFVVGKNEGHKITELRNLREISGTLTIENFENIKSKDEAMLANLVGKRQLDSISIISVDSIPPPDNTLLSSTVWRKSLDEEVLEGLQPHKDIKYLSIHSYFGSYFPSWINHIGDFLNTVYLHSWVNVEVLPPLGQLPSLMYLQIDNFPSVKLIDSCFYGTKQTVFPLLEELVLTTLTNCKEWKEARAREFFPRLSKLTITNNQTLREAPLHSFSSSLKELTIAEFNSLISLEKSIFHLSSLTLLKLSNSSTSVSFDPLKMPLLEELNLEDCSKLKIEGDLQSLTHLKRLKLVKCPQLFTRYFTRGQQKGKGLQVHQGEGLRSLTHIEADGYSHWYHMLYNPISGCLPSLRVLKLSNITQFTNHLKLWFPVLTTLKEIHFSNCEFEHLPPSLTLLSSLKKMVLKRCNTLQSLSLGMPPNLRELLIWYCSENLVQRCQPDGGEDWQFISSIHIIQIDGSTIRQVTTFRCNCMAFERRDLVLS